MLNDITIKTNNALRSLASLRDLTDHERSEFGYIELDEYSNRLVKFKDCWYDVQDTQRIKVTADPWPMGWAMQVPFDHPFATWNAVRPESLFSGVLFKFVDDDQVICATYFN